ncbi:MAG: hypothetical protein QOD72_3380, partial [Acidimicrobiaceae bacterium]|nr:hypothetical protein [Acidimicrobiaceae bacterium]
DALGEPTDTYVNGSQVWLRDVEGTTIEWRLHPVPRFRRPPGIGADELFESVVFAMRAGDDTATVAGELWEGLEAFPAYDAELEPAPLAAQVGATLGQPPDAFGVADHTTIGDAWERSGGDFSIVSALFEQLGG